MSMPGTMMMPTSRRQQTHGFQDMAAWHGYGFDLTGEHAEWPEVVEAARDSSNLLSVLGVQPALGRTFTAEEDRPEANHVVMLSWSPFRRRFAGEASVIGKQIHLDATPYTIIGVLPDSFTYPDPQIQLWVSAAPWVVAALYPHPRADD
jgi:hypothetical protein